MTVTTRRLVRSAAGTALVLALAAGCGTGDDQAQTPAEQPQPTQQREGAGDDAGASDGGGTTDHSPAASDGGGAAAADSDFPADADLATTELPVPAEDAVQHALDAAGGGDVHAVTIDHDSRNGWEWEIEIRNGTEEHDVDLSAITGEVIEHERDQDDDREPAVDVTSPMPYSEAIELALGAQDGRVSGWSLDSDDGRVHYEVDIVPAGSDDDVDVVVDVETKDVRIDD